MIKLQYVASSGNVYDLNSNGILTRSGNFHKWAWGTDAVALQYGERIAQFRRDAATYQAELVLHGTELARRAKVDALHQDMERDIRNATPGRLIWRDWYIPCYALESSTEATDIRSWTSNTVSFFCPRPFWIREESHSFLVAEGGDGEFLDYLYDYDYDYYKGTPGAYTWTRTFPFASDFEITIYGAVTDPAIYINGHLYELYTTINSGAYVKIDSRSHKITLVQSNGAEVNLFDARNKSSDIFQRVPGKTLSILWSGTFGFDITIYSERSEPTWS